MDWLLDKYTIDMGEGDHLGYFPLNTFASERGLTLTPGHYYKVKLCNNGATFLCHESIIYMQPSGSRNTTNELTSSIYPIPTSDYIFIDLNENKEVISIKIIDLKGSVIKNIDNNTSQKVDVSDIPVGIYIMQVTYTDQQINQRISIVR